MELNKYLGYRLSDVKPVLEEKGIEYTVVETADTKNTRMGDELRIVKIEEKEKSVIYVAYF